MGSRTLLFIAIFLFCSGGALFLPLLDLLGYMAYYIIGPESQWWTAPLRPLGIRYSLTLVAMSAVGIALNSQKLRYGAALLSLQEKLFLGFIGVMWLLRAISEPTEMYTLVDHPTFKLTKVAIFCLMLTHVVTDVKSLRILIWTLVLSTFMLGIEAYNAPQWMFTYGRLEGIGGADFSETNFLAAFIAGVLPLMGVLFLDSRWPGKLIAISAGVFRVNAIVLTRSRGAVVGMALGAVVATPLACQGLPAVHQVNALVAGTPAGLARQIHRLLEDADLRAGIARAGHRSATERFSWETVVRAFRAAVAEGICRTGIESGEMS